MYNEKREKAYYRRKPHLKAERRAPTRRKSKESYISSAQKELVQKPQRSNEKQPVGKRPSQSLRPMKRTHEDTRAIQKRPSAHRQRRPRLHAKRAVIGAKKKRIKRWLLFGLAVFLLSGTGWLGWQIKQGYYQFYCVATNSMMSYGPTRKSDRFAAGDVILVERRSLNTLRVNQIVSYHLADQKTVLTHRLVRIKRDRANNIVLLETQGDTNQLPDDPFMPKAYLGVVVLRLPFLGQISQVFSDSWVRWSAVGGIIGLVLGSFGWEVYGRWRAYSRAQAQLRRKKARKKRT